jgi:hypothetical protein
MLTLRDLIGHVWELTSLARTKFEVKDKDKFCSSSAHSADNVTESTNSWY